jgi:hypothetical protein
MEVVAIRPSISHSLGATRAQSKENAVAPAIKITAGLSFPSASICKR